MKNKNKAKAIRRRGEEGMRPAYYRMSGVDLATIDAVVWKRCKWCSANMDRIGADFPMRSILPPPFDWFAIVPPAVASL